MVVAFVGQPHRIDDRGSQVLKSLRDIGFQDYYLAEQKGWVLYVEGSTDLAILRTFAETLEHAAAAKLERPFVQYVGNQPPKAREHFFGLREARKDLVGFALFDRIDATLQANEALDERMWNRCEIENYLCQPATLLAYAEATAREEAGGPLFEELECKKRREAMQESIEDLVPRAALRDPGDPWWRDTKVSEDFLERVFAAFYSRLELPNLMSKTSYHVLARHVPRELVDPEVSEVLDAIVEVAQAARPAPDR